MIELKSDIYIEKLNAFLNKEYTITIAYGSGGIIAKDIRGMIIYDPLQKFYFLLSNSDLLRGFNTSFKLKYGYKNSYVLHNSQNEGLAFNLIINNIENFWWW